MQKNIVTTCNDSDKNMASIYLHIPFCKQACHYCNFHFSTNFQLKTLVIEAMKKELALRQHSFKDLPIATIYFGGGTPSLLSISEVNDLLQTIFKYFAVMPDVEITLEANPEDLTSDKLKGWHDMGINRLSIGIQSFNDEALSYMNRSHTSAMTQKGVGLARQAQFDNISIDLIYAIPNHTLLDWEKDLEKALSLEPEHISAYCLTVEEKTVFGHWKNQKKMVEVGDELSSKQFLLCIDRCQNAGYLHYEISNFCKMSKYAKHNTNYWKKGAYLGIGPSAHSYNGVERQWNISNNGSYIKAINQGKLPYSLEYLTIENHVNEYIMTSIRTCWGCDLHWIYKTYDIDLMDIREAYITQMVTNGLVYLEQGKLYLTNSGKLLADQITSDLFLDVSGENSLPLLSDPV